MRSWIRRGRRTARRLLGAAALLALAAPLQAGEVDQRLEEMDARLSDLEERLRATADDLEAANQRVASQQAVIERAGLNEPASLSALSRFLQTTEFDGWIATSWWWNLNRPPDGSNLFPGPLAPFGVNNSRVGATLPFHPDHNSFQLDQVWLSMRKQPTDESRAGFGVEILFGKTADILNATPTLTLFGLGPAATATASNSNLPHLYQAYLTYRSPLPGALSFTAGRFESRVGTESERAVENFNVTQGLVATLFHPKSHVGAKVEAEIGPAVLMLGISNDAAGNLNTDFDADKTFLWGVELDVSETIDLQVSGLLGGDALPGPPSGAGRSSDQLGVVDVIFRWVPSDRLSTWIDFDYAWSNHDLLPGSPSALGVAAAARYGVGEDTGISFRGEWVMSSDNFVDPTQVVSLGLRDQTLWSITGTLDHALTDQLWVRGEARYDHITTSGGANNYFITSRSARLVAPVFAGDQVVFGVEALYRF